MEPIFPQPGSAKDPKHFVGRVQTTRVATRKLLAGTNLLLNDPRRMGKTYWLTYLSQTTSDFAPYLIDYEGVSSREGFLLRTADALRKSRGLARRARETLSELFDGAEIGPAGMKVRIALHQQSRVKLLAELLDAVADDSSKPVLICMDEVPLAILAIAANEGPPAARELLQTLRMLRQSNAGIRWILAGSIGFHHVLADSGTTEGDLNDLDNLHLGPLTPPEAGELAERLLMGIGREYDDSAISQLISRTGAIPYILHKIASLLDSGASSRITTDEVDEVFEDYIDDRDESKALAHLLTRLEPNYGEDAEFARQILDRSLSRANDWLPLEEVNPDLDARTRFAAVVEKLVSDHYLVRRGTLVRWRYPTLQYLWARRRSIWERP